MKKFADWMNEGKFGTYPTNTKRLLLADGNSLSVQAPEYHYCSPRETMSDYSYYDSFEIGFPSKHYDSLEPFKDGPEDQTESVFGWVPVEVLEKLITEAGGVVGWATQE